MVSAPVVHYAVSILKRAANNTICTRCEPCTRPCIVCTFPQSIGYLLRKSYGPTFYDLQNRSKAFHQIQTNHGSRHLSLGLKSGGESAATEIAVISCTPFGSCHDSFLILFCYIVPFFHHSVTVLILAYATGIQTAGTGVDQVDNTVSISCMTFQLISGNTLYGFAVPACTNIGKHLSSVGQQVHEQHAKTIQYVVLCSQNKRLSCSVPVEGSIQHSLREVTVRFVVCPLSLTLETTADSVVSNSLFLAAFRQVRITLIQVLDDDSHLSQELPGFFLGLIRCFYEIRVLVEAFFAVLFYPCQSFLVLIFIIYMFIHTTKDLNLIYGLNAHAKIGLDELLIDDGSADTHGNGTDLQIGFALHGCSSNGSTTEAKQLLLNIIRNSHIVSFAYILTINTESRQTFLCMCSQYGSQVYSTRSLSSVHTPNSYDGIAVHIHCFCAIAPAWCNCKCNIYAFFAEFISTCSTFTYTSDCCISDNNFNRLTVGIFQIFFE